MSWIELTNYDANTRGFGIEAKGVLYDETQNEVNVLAFRNSSGTKVRPPKSLVLSESVVKD